MHFVYLWFDTQRKMFYIGSHTGDANDGYVSSSRWLTGEIHYRPTQFRRRILSFHNTALEAKQEEYRIISMIKYHEFGKRYYNMRSGRKRGCIAYNKGKPMSEEQKNKISSKQKGKIGNTKGMKFPNQTGDNNVMNRPENREKMKEIATGRRMATDTDGRRYWVYPEKSGG